jgi:uncharacterized membrane protein YbaN (DUF454 family)
MNPVARVMLLILGLVALGLGVLGIFLPVLPTTPFLLVAAACFVRSSDRLYGWLLEHRHLGPYVRDFRSGRGIPLRAKVVSLSMIWGSIVVSGSLLLVRMGPSTGWWGIAAFLLASALAGTYFVGFRTPTRRALRLEDEPALSED